MGILTICPPNQEEKIEYQTIIFSPRQELLKNQLYGELDLYVGNLLARKYFNGFIIDPHTLVKQMYVRTTEFELTEKIKEKIIFEIIQKYFDVMVDVRKIIDEEKCRIDTRELY